MVLFPLTAKSIEKEGDFGLLGSPSSVMYQSRRFGLALLVTPCIVRYDIVLSSLACELGIGMP